MHQTLERQMTEDERRRLFDRMPLAPSPFRSRPFKRTLLEDLVGLVVAIVAILWFQKFPVIVVILAALGLYLVWWLLHLRGRILKPLRRWREANERASSFHNAVAAAQTVRVHCLEADAVVQVTHDEGTVCLFDVGQGRTYWIDPYCIIPGRPPEDWPNRKFEVVDVPGVKEQVGPFCTGHRLRPRETVEFRDLFEHYDFEPPGDGIIHQPLDAFLRDAEARNRSAAGAARASL